MTDAIIEETWWEVTMQTGLILELPAPLQRIETSNDGTFLVTQANPLEVLKARTPVQSYSEITKQHYFLDPRNVALVKPHQVKRDTERLTKALMNLASSGRSSLSGQGPALPSDAQGNPRGPSTGGRIKRPIQ
jgi:hypothetical protein